MMFNEKYEAFLYVGLFELAELGVFDTENEAADELLKNLYNMELDDDTMDLYQSYSIISKIDNKRLENLYNKIVSMLKKDDYFKNVYNEETIKDYSKMIVNNLEHYVLLSRYEDIEFHEVEGLLLDFDTIKEDFEKNI